MCKENKKRIEEILARQTITIDKEGNINIWIRSDRSFFLNINDILIPEGSILIAEKQDIIHTSEMGFVIWNEETCIKVIRAEEDIGPEYEGLTVLGVMILIMNLEERISLFYIDGEWKDVSDDYKGLLKNKVQEVR